MVQNDVQAHWQSLLHARTVLVTGRVHCTQTVTGRGDRISSVADRRRLQAYVALRETHYLVQAMAQTHVTAAFWQFYRDLVRWMIGVAAPEIRPAMMRAHLHFADMMPLRWSIH